MDSPLSEGTTGTRIRRGATYVAAGARFLVENPSLAVWALIPALMQLVLLVVAGWWAFVWLPAWVTTIWAPTTGMFVHVYTGLLYTAAVAAWFALSVAIYLASGLFGAPFYDRLSADVEILVLGEQTEEESWTIVLQNIGWSMLHSGMALVLWVVCQLLFTLFQMLPVFGGLLELGSGVTVSSLFLARELMDGSMSRRRMSFRSKVETIAAYPALFGGFGAASGAVMWVPVLNTVTVPACVIGATLLVCELEKQGLIPDASTADPREVEPDSQARGV
jgi:CysZ protein